MKVSYLLKLKKSYLPTKLGISPPLATSLLHTLPSLTLIRSSVLLLMVSCSLLVPHNSDMTPSTPKLMETRRSPSPSNLISASVLLRPTTLTDTICSHLASTLAHSNKWQLHAVQAHIPCALKILDSTLLPTFLSNFRPSSLLVWPRMAESSTDLTSQTEPSGNPAMSIFAMVKETERSTTTCPACSTPTS